MRELVDVRVEFVAPRRFVSGTLVFLSSQKQTFQAKFQFDSESEGYRFVSRP